MPREYIVPKKTDEQELDEMEDDDISASGMRIHSGTVLTIVMVIVLLVIVYLIGRVLWGS